MNEKALQTLEFTKILENMEMKAISQMGKELCLELRPFSNIDDINRALQETTEAVGIVYKKGSLPLGGIKDIRNQIKRASANGVLSIEELMNISEFLYVCKKVVNYANVDNSKHAALEEIAPMLLDWFDAISLCPHLEAEINRCILNEQELADDASPRLREIRRNINISNGRIREQLNSIIHSQNYKNILQDSVVTMRNGRYCVPVKQEHRNNFQGMIHDQSSTGATIFVEPMAVVSLNNRIKELFAEEKNEIDLILRKLSALVTENCETLKMNVNMLTKLDFIFAKAELSLSMAGTLPIFNTDRRINIIKGRHPLLEKDTVVPTDIYLGESFQTLLITGPNTGGKTVSLKTLGLFTLMGQAGLHIPAFDNSELSVFDEVFADIGDEQSIEQNLSTFSGHMTNIVRILECVTDDSLVLLDELGAGTDPTEGAALAIAIIEYLHTRKIRTAVTTHYSELKVYALATVGVENAACEFNVETLCPTYKLLIGIPGKSNAFAISRRLGLPEHVIDSAKLLISKEDERFEDVITDLEISKKSVIIEQERAEQYRRDAEKLKKDYENQKEKLSNQREKILNEARNEARNIVDKSKTEADALIRDMQKIATHGANFKELEEKRRQLREKSADIGNSIKTASAPKKIIKPMNRKLCIGDKVYIHSLNQSGTVQTDLDSGGNVTVSVGIMKIKVKASELSFDETVEREVNEKEMIMQKVKIGKSLTISKELDLRGMMVDEALEKLDKYLDDAYLSSLERVDIIHGKGTGALRAAVTAHCRNHPHVKSSRIGEFGEGDTGVTVISLR